MSALKAKQDLLRALFLQTSGIRISQETDNFSLLPAFPGPSRQLINIYLKKLHSILKQKVTSYLNAKRQNDICHKYSQFVIK